MPLLIVVGIIVLIVIWIISLYNGLVRLRNRRENAFADIDVQLRQRHDLVPQLVETVKGYASHEKELLLKVTEARTAAMSATAIDDKIVAEQQLTAALQGLKVQVEAYPDLKANQNFLQLQEELSDIENKLAASRRFFHKDAAKLTRSESALLAAVLPAPTRFRVDAPSNYVRRRQAWIMRQMTALGGTAYVSGLD